MMSRKKFWEQHWVEAIVMLPSCLFLVVLVAKLNLFLWLAVIFFAQYMLRVAYNYVVVERKLLQGRVTHFQSSIVLFFSQLLVLCCGILLSSFLNL